MTEHEHEHEWTRTNGVIDTYPATYTWTCPCGVASHDRATVADCCSTDAMVQRRREDAR